MSLIIREMQIKTTDIFSDLSEWLSPLNQQTSAGKAVNKEKHFHTVDRNADWCSYCGKQYGDTSKIKNGSAF